MTRRKMGMTYCMQYQTYSQQQTITLGKKIATSFRGGDIVLLEGELGAGKTTLVKGIVKHFGIKNNITSPTFTLMNIYQVKSRKVQKSLKSKTLSMSSLRKQGSITQMVHIDTYRLKNEKDLIEIGVEDYLGAPETVCLIEWPEKLRGLLKGRRVKKIRIEYQEKNVRKIVVND